MTSQVKTDKHPNLLSKKGGRGFPHLVFMDKDGFVMATHEAEPSIASFEETAKTAKQTLDQYLDLKKKAESGDKTAKFEVLVLELQAGRVDLDQADKETPGLGTLSDDQKKKLEAARSKVVDTWVVEVASAIGSEAEAPAAGKKFIEWKKAGKPAPSGEDEVGVFYSLILMAAKETKDIETYEDALKALKKKFGSNPQAKDFFEQKDKELAGLKADKAGGKKDEKKDDGGK
ncbi:hypothetical protein HY251_13240 [bacterium]|nr:hypothetical protein [bacterium]